MYERSVDCDDFLHNKKAGSTLYGDAVSFINTGETGADRFVFSGASSRDAIYGFKQGKEVIDVQKLGYTDIS